MDHSHSAAEHAQAVLMNQTALLKAQQKDFDFIVCGAGSSGCVVAARLAAETSAQVLLLEAGGSDATNEVVNPAQWPTNLGSERDWGFVGQPTPGLNNRRLPLSMGKVLGGGSSINVMVWARGHREDWNHFAAESGDPDWGYDSILEYYRRIEDWQGVPDAKRRGSGGRVFIAQPAAPKPIAGAMVEAARSLGLPVYDSPNGEMMEGAGGAAIADLRIRDGKRASIFRSYTYSEMHRPNLTVVTGAEVMKLDLDGKRVVGVSVLLDGVMQQFRARNEVVLSLGAINTPKVLMLSGIGPGAELARHGINIVQDLPGVGQNHQDHLAFACTWAYSEPQEFGGGGCEAVLYWKSKSQLEQPDILQCQLEFPVSSPPEASLETPAHGWTMFTGLAQPKSRGCLRLSGADPQAEVLIEPNSLSEPEDLEIALAAVELCQEIGGQESFSSLVTAETAPRARDRNSRISFIRNAAITYWHQSCTAKMGRDPMAVVDAKLNVYGIDNLRIADASVMPRITSGNTMAPCVVIGERAADIIIARYGS